jgi:hypothetical protein
MQCWDVSSLLRYDLLHRLSANCGLLLYELGAFPIYHRAYFSYIVVLRPPRLLSRLDRERPANQMRRIFLSLSVWVAIFLHRSSGIESMKATENSRQSSHP